MSEPGENLMLSVLPATEREQMKILDPQGLAEGACGCYELMEREMDRIYEVPWRELAHRDGHKGK